MNQPTGAERAADLERRIRAYEELATRRDWPGAMTAADYWAAAVLTLLTVVGFSFWGV